MTNTHFCVLNYELVFLDCFAQVVFECLEVGMRTALIVDVFFDYECGDVEGPEVEPQGFDVHHF